MSKAFDILSKAIESIYFPLFLLAAICFVLFFKRAEKGIRIVLCIILSLSLGIRYAVYNISSRYFCVYIIVCILAIAFVANIVTRKNRAGTLKNGLYLFIILFALIVQVIKTFSGFSNNYILDTFDEIESISNRPLKNKIILLPENEKKRLYYPDVNLSYILPVSSVKVPSKKSNLESVRYIFGANIFSFNFVGKNDDLEKDLTLAFDKQIRCVSSKTTNKNKTKYLKNYRLWDKDSSSQSLHISREDDNLISNGDIEKTIGHKTITSKYANWISHGASHYSKDDLLLPEHSILLSTWETYSDEVYPTLYADSQNAIDGEYSLRVKFEHKNQFYFLNFVESTPGRLSFYIKNLGKDTVLDLVKIDYDSNHQYIISQNKCSLFLYDNKLHYISAYFQQDEFRGVYSLFSISAQSADFVIDNISYVPSPAGQAGSF